MTPVSPGLASISRPYPDGALVFAGAQEQLRAATLSVTVTTIMLVTKSRMAKELGASKSTISRACAGPLAAALVGTKVNPDHPAAVRWMEAYRLRDRATVLTERTPQPEPSPPAGLPLPPQGPAVFGCAEIALGTIAERWLGPEVAAQVERVLELRDTLILHMFRSGGADPTEFAARLGVPAGELWEVIRDGMRSEG